MGSRTTAGSVRFLRSRAGLSQQQLATRAGMAQSAISNYESGNKTPSLATLERLARAGGMELDISFTAIPHSTRITLQSLRRRRMEIESICARHGANRPRVFGSVAHGAASDDSDIDLLVDLEPG